MSVTAALLEALAEEGLDIAAVIRVARKVEAVEIAEREAREEHKRAGNAERQRRFKAKKGNAGNASNAGNALPPNEDTSNPGIPPVEPDGSTAPKGRSDRGAKIPADWEPPNVEALTPEAQALAKQWPAAAYRAEAEAFRNFWLSESRATARKSNWNQAWANRIVTINGRVMREWSRQRDGPATDLDVLMASVDRKYGTASSTGTF